MISAGGGSRTASSSFIDGVKVPHRSGTASSAASRRTSGTDRFTLASSSDFAKLVSSSAFGDGMSSLPSSSAMRTGMLYGVARGCCGRGATR